MSEIVNEGKKLVQGVGTMFGNATGYNQNNPEIYDIDRTAFNPSEQEIALTDALIARSKGQGNSPAMLQMQAGLDQQAANARAIEASTRGVSPGLAARLAQNANADGAAKMNQQAGILRAQEQMANDQLLQQAFQSQRQARMSREQLAASNTLGGENLENQAFDASADRSAGAFKSVGQASAARMSEGGMVPEYAQGGAIPTMAANDAAILNSFAQAVGDQVGQIVASKKSNPDRAQGSDMSKLGAYLKNYMDSGTGGNAPSTGMTSGPQVMMPASQGVVVPGKAKVQGDSLANDTVPAMLSPGEIVVPREVAKRSPKDIAKFVVALRSA